MSAPMDPQMTPDGMRVADAAEILNAQLNAAEICATKAGGAVSGAEARDFAQASLLLSQAVIVMDPSRSQGGTPLEHDIALEGIRQEGLARIEQVRGENALRQAKETAAAPTPAKEKAVSVRRDGHGRAIEYSVKG